MAKSIVNILNGYLHDIEIGNIVDDKIINMKLLDHYGVKKCKSCKQFRYGLEADYKKCHYCKKYDKKYKKNNYDNT